MKKRDRPLLQGSMDRKGIGATLGEGQKNKARIGGEMNRRQILGGVLLSCSAATLASCKAQDDAAVGSTALLQPGLTTNDPVLMLGRPTLTQQYLDSARDENQRTVAHPAPVTFGDSSH
jgi:hypothetical protein